MSGKWVGPAGPGCDLSGGGHPVGPSLPHVSSGLAPYVSPAGVPLKRADIFAMQREHGLTFGAAVEVLESAEKERQEAAAERGAGSPPAPTRLPGGSVRWMSMHASSPMIGLWVMFSRGDGVMVNGATEFLALIGQVFTDPHNPRPYCNLLVFAPFAAPQWEGSVQEVDPNGPADTWCRSWRRIPA